jgi:hypothetical protein
VNIPEVGVGELPEKLRLYVIDEADVTAAKIPVKKNRRIGKQTLMISLRQGQATLTNPIVPPAAMLWNTKIPV